MEHENKGQGGTQSDYNKPAILDNDEMVEHYIGNLGYNANVGLAQFKRRGLGNLYDNVSYVPDDQTFEFMGAIKKQKLAPAQYRTKEDAMADLKRDAVKGSLSEQNTSTTEDAGVEQQLQFTMGDVKGVSNREEKPVEAVKEGLFPH